MFWVCWEPYQSHRLYNQMHHNQQSHGLSQLLDYSRVKHSLLCNLAMALLLLMEHCFVDLLQDTRGIVWAL